jgi:hypothetical protein
MKYSSKIYSSCDQSIRSCCSLSIRCNDASHVSFIFDRIVSFKVEFSYETIIKISYQRWFCFASRSTWWCSYLTDFSIVNDHVYQVELILSCVHSLSNASLCQLQWLTNARLSNTIHYRLVMWLSWLVYCIGQQCALFFLERISSWTKLLTTRVKTFFACSSNVSYGM